jgi:hypothetical protein
MSEKRVKIGNIAYTLTYEDKEDIAEKVKDSLTKETWTFTLEDGSTITKAVILDD